MGVVSDFKEIGTAIHNNWLNFIVTGVMIFSLYKYMDARFEKIDAKFERVDQRFEQVDKRFEELKKDSDVKWLAANHRIDETNKRLDALYRELISIKRGN